MPRLLLVISALFLSAATFVHAQAPTSQVLRIATLAPPGSEVVRGLEAWGQELRRQTQGRVSFRIYAGGVQGDDAEMVRKLQMGRIDIASLSGAGLAQVYRPALALQLPSLVRSYEELDRARDAVAADLESGARANGFRVLGWFEVGRARLMSTTPVHSPRELANKRAWMRPGEVMLPVFLSAVGAAPVNAEVPEVIGALSTGRMDVVLAPPLAALALGWSSRLRYVTDLPLSFVIGATVASERSIAALPEDARNLLIAGAATRHVEARRRARAADDQAMQALVSRGMQVVPTSEADRAAWIQMGRSIRERVASSIAPAAFIARLEAAAQGGQRR